MTDNFDRFLPSFFRRLSVRWWLVLGAALLLWRLGYAPLWNPDEGRYASAAREIIEPLGGAPDWVVPHLNSIPRLNKPPLVYWLAAISFKMFGTNEWAARLSAALAALGVMLLLFHLGRTMFGGEKKSESAGVAGALVWTTAMFSFAMARVVNTDMLLCAAIALALGGIWLALESEEQYPPSLRGAPGISAYFLAGIGLGAALLSKGPVGVAFPLIIGFVYLCVARRWNRVNWLGVAAALVLAILIASPWYLSMEARRPGFLHRFIFEENLGRFSGKSEFHKSKPIVYYIPIVLAGLLPWTGALILAVARLRQSAKENSDDKARRARLFLWLWALLLIGFFSLSSTKLASYVLPAMPPLALLLGEAIANAVGKRDELLAARRWMLGVSLFLNAAIFIGAAIYLTNEITLPRAEGLPFVAAAGLFLGIGSLLLIQFWRRDIWRFFCANALMATGLYVTLLGLAGRIAPYEDSSVLVKTIAPQLRPGDVIAHYDLFQPSAIFYSQRPQLLANFGKNPGLDETHPNYGKIFLSDDASLLAALGKAPRWFLLARRVDAAALKFLGKTFLIARNNDFLIVSNRPSAGVIEFVAPRKINREFAPPKKTSGAP